MFQETAKNVRMKKKGEKEILEWPYTLLSSAHGKIAWPSEVLVGKVYASTHNNH